MDAGTAISTAYAGLFRMGELTSTDANPFDHQEELCESSLVFEPTFWTARSVTIKLGKTKADQEGVRDKQRPRMLPIDDEEGSPGRAIRNMLAARHHVRFGQEPTLRPVPLFQNGKGGHLSRDAVLNFMRDTLRLAGYEEHRRAQFGTHSCRIGGATRLFQIGATPDVFKHLGGWASEAYREYIRIQQMDLMDFSRRICQ